MTILAFAGIGDWVEGFAKIAQKYAGIIESKFFRLFPEVQWNNCLGWDVGRKRLSVSCDLIGIGFTIPFVKLFN